MKKSITCMSSVLIIVLIAALAVPGTAQDKAKKADMPVLVTTCGQAPDAVAFKLIMRRDMKYTPVIDEKATVDVLKKQADDGKAIKTIIIITGTSLKGMGAAGVSIDDEIARTDALIKYAKEQGMTIIAAHTGGKDRRQDEFDEQSIRFVCPKSDMIILLNDANEDGYFTGVGKEKKIPVIQFENKTMELPVILKDIFVK